MRFTKIMITIAIALSLVVLPILPMGGANAATTYTYQYQTNYYSYSVPVQTYNTVNTYTLYYDVASGKYYLVPKTPVENEKPAPSNPGNSTKPVETPKPAPPKPEAPKPVQPKPEPVQPVTGSQFEQKVADLVNQERAKFGLSPLAHNGSLSQVARLKSEDMRDKKYFSHTSPTYGSPFDMMKQFGISYRTAGENIAAGQTTPEQVVKAWMDSPGHRANILNSQYTQIGVGYAKGGSYGHYWTQMFIGK
ncbi:MAG: CAP domain-containing protein [Bacillota bacterium]